MGSLRLSLWQAGCHKGTGNVCPEASETGVVSSFVSWCLTLASAEDVSILGVSAASSLNPDP